ncbi:hypothetical protein AWB64_02141 [Caballeronia sordidicola]|uniref:Uncharacterized protein n=1 Tax=Caballeronia sordidicola TaxID=196367 RepID=A0A158G295_CABSO|nr:hypothetical protein [Caballeronia sordidicola]SAL26152.1 hypothetical protein AWB64_02141 [Caballeronia sordidicola]
MKTSEVIQQIKAAVDQCAEAGQTVIAVPNMQTYIDEILATALEQESFPPQVTEAQAQHQLEVWKTQLSAQSGMTIEMFKAVIEAGQTALKSAILLNGGAAVAMLAFVGNAVTKLDGPPLTSILTKVGGALFVFMIGAGSAGTSTAMRYLSQAAYGNAVLPNAPPYWHRWGSRIQWVSIALGVASYASFFAGGWIAFRAIVVP